MDPVFGTEMIVSLLTDSLPFSKVSTASSTINQESEGTSQKIKPRMGKSKSHTSIYSRYPPIFTRALTGPTKGISSFPLQRGSTFLANVLTESETPGHGQKSIHNKEDTFAKSVYLTRLLNKTKVPSSSYAKARCTKFRSHSSKEKPPYAEDPQLYTVMAPSLYSTPWPLKSSSEITYPNLNSAKTSPKHFTIPKCGQPQTDSKSLNTSPKHFALPKCVPLQKCPDSSKKVYSFLRSCSTSPDRCSIRKSISPEKLSNGSKSPDTHRSNLGSRAPSPERHAKQASSSPQHCHNSSSGTVFRKKSPDRSSNFAALQKYISFIGKIYPDLNLRSKSRSNSPQSSPKCSVMKPSNSISRKASPERCSKLRSVSPARDRESPKPEACPDKSDSRQPHLIPRKNIEQSGKAPLPRKVRYKISTSKTYVKYTKSKTNKSNKYRLRPMSTNIEIMYLTELNCLVDKFISSMTEKRTKCPVLTERLKSHQQKCPVRTKCYSTTATTAQTKCTFANTGRLSHESCDGCKNRLGNVHEIVKMWLNKIPLQTSRDTPHEATGRCSAVQELINSIVALEKNYVDDSYYKRSVNIAADRYFNEIRIFHPGPREDKNALKNGLKKYLILKLQQNRKKCRQNDQKISLDPFAVNTQEPSCNCNKLENTKGSDVFIVYNDQSKPSVNFLEKSATREVRMQRSNQISKPSSRKPSPSKSHDLPSRGKSQRNSVTLNLNSSARCGGVSPNSVDSLSNLTRKEKIEPFNPNTPDQINRHLYKRKFTDKFETANQIDGNKMDKLLMHETNCVKTTNKLKSPPTGNICIRDNSIDCNESLSRKNTNSREKRSGRYRRYHRENLNRNENNDCGTKMTSYKQNKNESINSHNMSKYNYCAQFKNHMVCGDACPRIEKKKPKHFEFDRSYLVIEKEIDAWLKKCTFIEQFAGVVGCYDKSKVINALLSDLKHYFNQPHDVFNKPFWTGRIITILKSFYAGTGDPIQYESFITRFADDFANRFVGFLSRLQCIDEPQWNCDISYKCYDRLTKNSNKVIVGPNVVSQEVLRLALLSNIEEYFQNKHFVNNNQIKKTIVDLLINNIELIQNDLDNVVKKNMIDIIKEINTLSDFEIENLVDNILKSCKVLTIMLSVVNNNTNKTELHEAIETRHCISVSVLTSLNDMTPSFNAVSSTPKKKPKKLQYASQLNPEQQAYAENLKEVIKSWVDSSPPNFIYRKGSEDMTEVMLEDLSGEISDHLRLEQIINRYSDKEQVITIYIYKCLLKYEVVEDIQSAESYTKELVSKILQITVPNMTRPRHGNRQDIEMIKQAANTQWTEPYYPQVQDILEDQISVFMDEYPTEIFVDTDKNARVHELAEKIQPKLDKASSNKEVEKDVNLWMKTMVLPRLKDRVEDMAHSLVERLKRIPHDETLAQYGEKTKQQRLRKQREKYEKKDQQEVVEQGPTPSSASKFNDLQDDNDKTMTRFVAEYLEHCHAEADPLTKKMFAQILKSELRRLDHNALKDVYTNKKYEQFNAEKLNKELIYIKEVSDWLKTIPMDSFYNTVENTDRADFILGVVKNIIEVEEERSGAPDAMDYDLYLGHNIAELFGTLPILPSHRDTVHLAIVDLIQRLAVLRGEYYIEPIPPGQGILHFIEEFMKRHGPEIADDKLKLEAWSARLLKELRQLLIEGQVQDKKGFEQKLQLVPKPGDDSVKHFNLELAYAKEIVDWLKNLELRESLDESNVEELALKMADNKMNCTGGCSTKDIINDWVKRLPLNENERNNISILTMQLANRLEKVTEKEDLNAIHPADISVKLNTSNMRNKSMQKEQCRNCCPVDDPGKLIVSAIERWIEKLDIKGKENEAKNFKEFAKAILYQKISDLYDAHLYKSNRALFEHCLSEEVNNLFNSLPPPLRLKGNKEDLKQKLIDSVLRTCEFISEVSAAETYRIKLENAIQSLLPKPGIIENNHDVELLTDHIIDKFILDNFDHANNTDIKKMIQKDIERHAHVAQKLCALPIDKEKCIEGVYGSLYTVEIPNLEALKENVELVKTKCVIKEWFEALPIQSVDSVGELKRNKKFMCLAQIQRCYELDNASQEKMADAIRIFLQNELQPGVEGNINTHIKGLLNKLEHTKLNRKFTETSEKSSERNGKKEPRIVNSIIKRRQIVEQEIKKPADIVLEIVEEWCDRVLTTANLSAEESEKKKNFLESKIIMKVCELNSSPTTLYSDLLYAHLLEEEVKKTLLSFGLPPNNELISQLTLAIESVRPLFIDEKSRYAYKNELENAVNRFVKMPVNPKQGDIRRHDEVKDSIISYYLEYKCNSDDEKQKKHYTDKIVDVLTDYNYDITDDNYDDIRAECLVEVNRLLHELNQIPEPGDIAMNEEIVENRLKQEVNNFLTDHKKNIKNIKDFNQVRDNLSRELNEIEKCGHNKKSDEKIKTAVKRNMKKLSASIPKEEVDAFVDRLKKNEAARKQTRFRKSDQRNLSLPTYSSDANRRQSLRKSLPVSFKDYYPTGYPQSPIAMPKMVPYPPIVLPENSNASWNAPDYGQVPQQNIDSSGRSALSNRSYVMPHGRATWDNMQPPQDTSIPPLPQFHRYPPLNLPTDTISTWNSTQPGAVTSPQNIPAGIPNTQFSQGSKQGPPAQVLSTLGNTVRGWTSSDSGAQFVQQNVPATVHMPPTGVSPKQSPYSSQRHDNQISPGALSYLSSMTPPGQPAGVSMQPPQDMTIPSLPQFNRYPPLNLPTDTISTWNSTQPGAVPSPQNIHARQTVSAQVVPGRSFQKVSPSTDRKTGTNNALNGGLQPMGTQHQTSTQISDQGFRSTRSQGVTTKPPTSEFGGQKSLGALPYVPCPFMLPVPSCLADIERLSRISLQQQIQVLQDTIKCDCENCMEGFPFELLSGWDGDRPCGPYPA